MFENFKLETVAQSNAIWLELDLSLALKALQSCVQSQNVIMRLAKKSGQPFLCIETRTHFNVLDQQMDLKLDIPCSVMNGDQISLMKSPNFTVEPRVSIFLPHMKELRPVVDRMKAITEHVTLSATLAKTLSIRADTDAVQLVTFFKDLRHPGDMNKNLNPNIKMDARISTKTLAKIMAVNVLNGCEICLSFHETHVSFHIVPELADASQCPFYITYYIPLEVA